MSLELFNKLPDGSLEINPLKHMTFPYYLCTDPPNTVAVVAAAGISGMIPMNVTQEGPFEGMCFTGQWNNPVTMTIEDRSARRVLMNQPIHIANIVGGTAGAAGDGDVKIAPFLLPQTLFLHQRRSLSVNFTDLGVAGANVRFAIGGRRFYPSAAGSKKLDNFIKKKLERYNIAVPYFLTTDNPAVFAGAGTATFRMSVGPDGHFVGHKIMYVTNLGADPTMYLSDAETGRIIMNGLPAAGIMQAADAMGTGMGPYIFPEPWFIERNGAINLTITAAGAGTVWPCIAGVKLYVK